jgi:hypothetical protein
MRIRALSVVWCGVVLVLGCADAEYPNQSSQSALVSRIDDDSFRASAACADCAILNRSTVVLPLTGKMFTEAKLWSPSTGIARRIALDNAAATVDADDLIRAEGLQKIARQGKLRDDVYAASLTSSPGLLSVWIWADYREDPQPREPLIANPALRTSGSCPA